MSKKIYLSLDDLNKLYGLSPAVISAIKKKRKRRRNKKNKINNGTMGNKPSDSSHMAGYSSAIAVASQQLQQANLNKHIKEINDNNQRVRIEQEPDNLHPNDPEVQFFNQVKEGVKSGKLKVSKTQTGFTVVDKKLANKPGPKTNSRGRVFELTPVKVSTGLSNTGSNKMNRDSLNIYADVLGDFLGDGIPGSLNKGTGSDKFVSEDAIQVFDATEPTIQLDLNLPEPNNDVIAAAVAAVDDGSNFDMGDQELPPSSEILIDENAKQVPPYLPKKITSYTGMQLSNIAKKNGIKTKGNVLKQTIYDLLLAKELV